MKLLHDASVKVLDIVYLKFEEIYSKLCMVATGENYCTKDGRQSLSVLTSDLMLLAVSVIGAASYIVNKSTSDMVTDCITLFWWQYNTPWHKKLNCYFLLYTRGNNAHFVTHFIEVTIIDPWGGGGVADSSGLKKQWVQ